MTGSGSVLWPSYLNAQLFKRDATLLAESSKTSENVTEKLNSHSFKLILAIIPTCAVILRLAN